VGDPGRNQMVVEISRLDIIDKKNIVKKNHKKRLN
jgi:hypothetical protein